MANFAIADRARFALEIDEFDRIARLRAGGNGMGAVMAGLTINAAVAFRQTVERVVRLVDRVGVTLGTLRLVFPWAWVVPHLRHATVTIDAGHVVFCGHNIPQAAGRGTGVAVVTAIQGIRNNPCVLIMHGIG